jgi:hypothetical protein
MRQKKPLIVEHIESWNKLKNLLSDLGEVPYINFSDVPIEIPKSLLPPEHPSSKNIDYEIIVQYFPSSIRSHGIIVTRPLGEVNNRLHFKKTPVELRYYIPGTSVPPKSREKYNKNKLVKDVITANVENCFREINPKFYSFYEYLKSYHFKPIKEGGYEIGRILPRFLEPYWDNASAYYMGRILLLYVTDILGYFSSKIKPEFVSKRKKDILTEIYEYWTQQRSIKYLMKEPFEILRDTMWKQGDLKAEDVLFKIEDLYDVFAETLKKVYKLEINGNWIRL